MASKRDEDIEKEYTELRLRYALEDPEVKKLFEEWIRTEKELIAIWDKHSFPEESFGAGRVVQTEANELWKNLVKKLHAFGIPLYSSYDIYATYCHITRKKKWNHADILARGLPSVLVKTNSKDLSAAHLKKDIHIIKDIFEKGNFDKHEEWFRHNYDNLTPIEDLDDGTERNVFELNAMLNGRLNDEPWTFNKETKTFYRYQKGGTYLDDEHIEGPTIFEESILEDGKYLRLKLDLSTNTEHIQAELKYVVKCFKDIFDETALLRTKARARRQDIRLYERYLRVYHLVQEQGKDVNWSEVAKKEFPEDFKSEKEQLESDSDYTPNPESAIAKVHKDYEEAKRLIREGLP